jgi:hypothetical protein
MVPRGLERRQRCHNETLGSPVRIREPGDSRLVSRLFRFLPANVPMVRGQLAEVPGRAGEGIGGSGDSPKYPQRTSAGSGRVCPGARTTYPAPPDTRQGRATAKTGGARKPGCTIVPNMRRNHENHPQKDLESRCLSPLPSRLHFLGWNFRDRFR